MKHIDVRITGLPDGIELARAFAEKMKDCIIKKSLTEHKIYNKYFIRNLALISLYPLNCLQAKCPVSPGASMKYVSTSCFTFYSLVSEFFRSNSSNTYILLIIWKRILKTNYKGEIY